MLPLTLDALLALVLNPCFPASLLPSRPGTSLAACFPPPPSKSFFSLTVFTASLRLCISLSLSPLLPPPLLTYPAWQQVMTRFIACQSAAVGKVCCVALPHMPLSSHCHTCRSRRRSRRIPLSSNLPFPPLPFLPPSLSVEYARTYAYTRTHTHTRWTCHWRHSHEP